MPAIVITEFMDEGAVARLDEVHETLYDPALVDAPDRLRELVADARALVVRNRTQVRSALLERTGTLTCVGRLGVGLDNIDVEACRDRGIAVFPATGANDLSVAEYVIATAMLLLRGAYGASDAVLAGDWPRQRLIGRELSGRTLGLIGFGAIARLTATKARALGMATMAHDPFVAPDDPIWGETRAATQEEVLANADVVSLHVPLTDATRRLIDRERLAAMRPNAVLINAARGGVVDEAALVEALREGRLGGAALDVFENEPLSAEAGAAFRDAPNLILTPHVAGVTDESNVRVSNLIADRVLAHLAETGS